MNCDLRTSQLLVWTETRCMSSHITTIGRVIAYASTVLTKTERQYCATRREMLALVWSVRQFRAYLWGRKFIVHGGGQVKGAGGTLACRWCCGLFASIAILPHSQWHVGPTQLLAFGSIGVELVFLICISFPILLTRLTQDGRAVVM